MRISQRLQGLLERRWLLVPMAIIMALISAFLLWVTLRNAYFDYWYFPRESAADGYSTYPEVRYSIFDFFLTLWCVEGLIASYLSLRSAILSRSIAGWTFRTITIYFFLLVALFCGGLLMMYVRSRGF